MPRHTPPWVAIPPIPRLSAPVLATPCLAATRLAKLRLAYPEPAPPSFAAPCFALTRLSTTIHVEEFIVTYCTSDVSKGGWWYSESPMAWPVGDQFVEFLKRSEPGPGASAPDDEHGGDVKIKNKSIPNLPTGRLQRRLGVLHSQIHTTEGLHGSASTGHDGWDQSKRSLAETGIKTRMITHELRLRGQSGTCPHCWGQRS